MLCSKFLVVYPTLGSLFLAKVLDVMKPILHKRKIEYELEGFGCATS